MYKRLFDESNDIRTFTPYSGSKLHKTNRANLARDIQIYTKIKKENEWDELIQLVKIANRGRATQSMKNKINILSDSLNKKGYSDKDIENALNIE